VESNQNKLLFQLSSRFHRKKEKSNQTQTMAGAHKGNRWPAELGTIWKIRIDEPVDLAK
jgi:hypothetical protein